MGKIARTEDGLICDNTSTMTTSLLKEPENHYVESRTNLDSPNGIGQNIRFIDAREQFAIDER